MEQKSVTAGGGPTVSTLKRRKISRQNTAPPTDRVKLERVLGFTVTSSAALSCDNENGIIAYPAGCTVVLYSNKKNRQAHIINSSKKQISCLAFSPDGKYLATGESGHQPMVRVWDATERTQVSELPGHKFGIVGVIFSPNMKYLISIGNQYDMVVNVWNWKSNAKVATNKVSCKVKAVSFSEVGSYFVTVGVRHVKFWYLERNKTASKYQDTVPLQGRSAILADQRNNNFCDVACGAGSTGSSTFCITQSGLLCEFNSRRLLEKWVELKTRLASSLVFGDNNLFVGCADGIVRVFQADTLSFLATLPRPHYLGVDVAAGLTPAHMMSAPSGSKYPDTVALCFDAKHRKLTCIYSDHSLYQWDVNDLRLVGKVASFLYHSSCIWGIEVYPVMRNGPPSLPPDTFMTCSSDDTIRFWNLDPNMPNDMTTYKHNIYTQEILKILYVDPEHQFLCDNEINAAQADKVVENTIDEKNGVRVIRISPDGRNLATGDRRGNLRVFRTNDGCLIRELEAHDGDILALEFTDCNMKGPYFLATASRDRIIHVLDVDRHFEHVCSMEGHSSAVTAIKFTYGAEPGSLNMLSCGSDKSIIFRKFAPEPDHQFVRTNCVAAQMTLYDMEMDPLMRWVYTACQDRQIRSYNVSDGKLRKSFKGSLGESGTLIKLQLENSGGYVATSCSDKNLAIFDVKNGDCVASMFGHGELVTGMKFSNDFRHLITVSGDSCIFVWRLSADLTNQMLSKMATLEKKMLSIQTPGAVADIDDDTDDTASEFNDDQPMAQQVATATQEDYSSELPSWARRRLGQVVEDSPPIPQPQRPAGKWGQRLAPEGASLLGDGYRKSSLDMNPNVGDDSFLGPESGELISEKFNVDAMEKSPLSHVNHRRPTGLDMSKNFGSLANVRLVGDDNEPANQKNGSPSTIFYTDSNIASTPNEFKEFEVKDRSMEISKSKNYSRADTFGNDLSDDEENQMTSARSSSTINLKDGFPAQSIEADLHARQHKMILDAYEKLDDIGSTSVQTPDDNAFQRGDSNRNSITSKFLKNSSGRYNVNDSSSTIWGSSPVKAMVSQMEALKSQYDYVSRPGTASSVSSSLSGPSSVDAPTLRNQQRSKWQVLGGTPMHTQTIPAYQGRESSEPGSKAGWSYKPPATKASSPIVEVDPKNVLRAKNLNDLSKNRERRRTLSSFAYASPEDEFIDDDMNRRRARSPATSLLIRRDSGSSSIFSSASMVGGRYGLGHHEVPRPYNRYVNGSSSTLIGNDGPRISASISMSSLVFNPDSDQNVKKMSDLRAKLRKSQENLALSSALESASPISPNVSSGSRSKSIGSLTHAQLQENNLDHSSETRQQGRGESHSLANTLNRVKELTKSVGNLHQADGGSADRRPSSMSRPLTETLNDFRKISNPDLSRALIDEEDEERGQGPNVSEHSGSFYSPSTASTTLPRYRKASGVVQKKVESANRRVHNLDRASASGDSEDSSDTTAAVTASYPQTPVARSISGLITKRQQEHYASPRRTPSMLESRKGSSAYESHMAQITSTPLKPNDVSMTGVNRRNSSYLAKILSDEGADEKEGYKNATSGKRIGGSNMVASEGSETFDGHVDKMASHCKDSVSQLRTALDKILQAYQMVRNDGELSEADRDNLQTMLKTELEEARRRLTLTLSQPTTFVRHEPEGGVDDSSVVNPSTMTTAMPADPAASVYLQQYSDLLVNLIQQKISTNGQK